MSQLKAKSGEDGATLVQHTTDVFEAADEIWKSIERDLRSLIPDLPENLATLKTIAAWLHDLCKANSTFQEMLASNGQSKNGQPVRHEILAVAFLTGEGELSEWFKKLIPDTVQRWAIIWAIAGHHFKMIDPARNSNSPAFRDRGAASEVVLNFGHDDVKELLSKVSHLFEGTEVPKLRDLKFKTSDDDEGSLRERIDNYITLADENWNRLRSRSGTKTLIAVMKLLLAAADAAGSATDERGLATREWVQKTWAND